MRSPVQPVKYVCADEAPQSSTPATRNAITVSVERLRSLLLDPDVDRLLREKRRRSASPVARSSEPSASPVRALYGEASRASARTRRAVWRHDQSETFAPRGSDKELPGCQTFTDAHLRSLVLHVTSATKPDRAGRDARKAEDEACGVQHKAGVSAETSSVSTRVSSMPWSWISR